MNAINDTPILTEIGDQVTDEDTDFSIALSASDVDIDENGQTLTFSAVSSDESLVLVSTTTDGDGTTGTLMFDVLDDENGEADITVTVTDSEGAGDTTTFILTVNAINDVPEIANVTIDPTVPTNNDDLNLIYDYFDIEGDAEFGTTTNSVSYTHLRAHET